MNLTEWAHGARSIVKRLLADPVVTSVVVEHEDRPGGVNVEWVQVADARMAAVR
ncbi:MAG TPA: hypothetical protein VIR27_13500 [Mycobacteriales bacterium]